MWRSIEYRYNAGPVLTIRFYHGQFFKITSCGNRTENKRCDRVAYPDIWCISPW